MSNPIQAPSETTVAGASPRFGYLRAMPPPLVLTLAALVVCFAWPLIDVVRFSLEGELYSYIALVPFVSIYLFATARREPGPVGGPIRFRSLAGWLLAIGMMALAARWVLPAAGITLVRQDTLALMMLAFVALTGAACARFLSASELKHAAFPLAFLLFMIPFPLWLEENLEHFLQHGSVPVAFALFQTAGTTVYHHDLIFELPGIAIQVAPECSGIRSTIVLFMTSLLAGSLFLRSAWSRTILAAFVIPLALLRNGFRIFVLGELCVRIGPHMIHSDIHHKGGSIFFALSLVPFFALLYCLIRWDRRRRPRPVQSNVSQT